MRKKTEGILSICPGCYDMPVCITNGNGYMFKEYNIHNGTRGVIKGLELSAEDIATFANNTDKQIVLQALPKRLIIEVTRGLKKQYPGMPHNCFPLSPVTVYWTLDQEGEIQISRKGFPIVPNFSITVDSATGKTLETALPDLDDIGAVPTFKKAMKGYIGLSRVKRAHDIYLPRAFSPALFRQGEQPWPTLLLEFLRGNRGIANLQEDTASTNKQSKKKTLLKLTLIHI